VLSLFEKIKRFIKEWKWGTLLVYVLFIKTKKFTKRTKSTLVFMFRLSKLLTKKNNDEICFITFDVITGNYKVLTYFSTEHSLGLFHEVLKSMSKSMLEYLTKSDKPKNVAENVELFNKDGNC
jgi:hypothetical protein